MSSRSFASGASLSLPSPCVPPVPATGRLPAPLRRLADTLACWAARSRARRQLEQLDDRMLLDIGVDRSQVLAESAKFFWQA